MSGSDRTVQTSSTQDDSDVVHRVIEETFEKVVKISNGSLTQTPEKNADPEVSAPIVEQTVDVPKDITAKDVATAAKDVVAPDYEDAADNDGLADEKKIAPTPEQAVSAPVRDVSTHPVDEGMVTAPVEEAVAAAEKAVAAVEEAAAVVEVLSQAGEQIAKDEVEQVEHPVEEGAAHYDEIGWQGEDMEAMDVVKALEEQYEKDEKLCDECCDGKGPQSMTSSKENDFPAEEEQYEGHDEMPHEHNHSNLRTHHHHHHHHDRSSSLSSNYTPRFMQPTTAWKGKGEGHHIKRPHSSRPAWVSTTVSKRDATFDPTMQQTVSQINIGDRSRSTTPPQDPNLPRYMQATAAVVGKYLNESNGTGRKMAASARAHKVHHKDQRRATPVPFY